MLMGTAASVKPKMRLGNSMMMMMVGQCLSEKDTLCLRKFLAEADGDSSTCITDECLLLFHTLDRRSVCQAISGFVETVVMANVALGPDANL